VERHCDLAAYLAAVVDAAPDLERLAEVPLNVVCFRYHPAGRAEPELDDVNRRLSEALLDDGRVFAGGTVYGGRVALRPAISNWRTTATDLDLLVEVVRELGAKTVSAT
jgi:glutamate/tyrosine decarboxylase-like PLP-dependent enzyme